MKPYSPTRHSSAPPAPAKGATSAPSEGLVVERDSAQFTIHCGPQILSARQAVSCLVTPEVGDTVLLHHGEQQIWVLAILDRLDPQQLTLAAPGKLRIQAETLQLEGQHGQLSFDETTLRSRRATMQVDEASLVTRLLRSVCERITSRAKRSSRFVTEADTVHCGSHNLQADEQIRVHGKHVLTSAKGLVRFDGEQIHMG